MGVTVLSYSQYLNCRGDGGDASPHRDRASPHRDLGVPPSRFERWFMGGKSYCFWPEKTLKFSISARKSLRISAKTFSFWKSPVFGRKHRLNFRFRPENYLRISAKTLFFGDHLIFTEISPQSNSGTMKIWVKFVYGINSQKILATCLFFANVQSKLKKRPPMQNFTIQVLVIVLVL